MKVIIIGAVAAGSKCASKLKRLRPDWDIVIYTSDENVSYSACGMPYYIAGDISNAQKLIIRTVRDYENKGIRVFINHKVEKILPNEKSICIKNMKTDEVYKDCYDKLVIATGAAPYRNIIENDNISNIFEFRTLQDGIKIKDAVLRSRKAVILGVGYIGIETLEAFLKQGLYVTLIQSTNHIMSIFDDDMSEIVQKYIMQKDLEHVKIITNDTIDKFIGLDKVKKVITKNGLEIDTDLVLIATGVTPNVELAKDAGIELGVTGAIKVTSRMETNIPDIYACGDCVEKYHIVGEAPCWIPLGSTSGKEGRCCAINVSGEVDEFEGVLGSAVTRYFDLTMAITGLTEKTGFKYGFEPVSVIINKNDKAGYMPDVKKVVIKLTADRKTKRILGAQAIGTGDADKRINTLTSALLSKMTINEFLGDDITYAPPYSTSIDLMLTAAQKLSKKLENN